jgi:hypothetical protein
MQVTRAALFLVALAACGSDTTVPPEFPPDYALTYSEVRNCRLSVDHDMENVRVVASPPALVPYMNRTDPFPLGAVLLKEQYDRLDTTCAGPILDYSVMVRVANGNGAMLMDWNWQHVSADRTVIAEDIGRCTRCHANCAAQGVGYAGTCEEP